MATQLKRLAFVTAMLLAAVDSASAETRLDALAPQRLDAGQCGLFLWARSADQSFVMVAYDQPSLARVRLEGRDRELQRTAFAGEPVQGHFESQTYSDGRMTIRIDVEFDPEKPVRDGAILRRGLMRFGENGAAETVMPVGGMVACKRV